MKKGLDKFIKVYMEILYALSSIFYAGFCFCVLFLVTYVPALTVGVANLLMG